MKNICYFKYSWLIMVFMILPSLAPNLAAAEEVFLAKDRDISGMGVELNKYLNKIKSNHGIIIYSGCNAEFGTDILIITNVLKHGLLLEFEGKQLGNIAFVDMKDNDGSIIDDMMGGQWTIHRAQNNVNQIVQMPFHIFLGKNPAELFDMKFPGKCEDYKGR